MMKTSDYLFSVLISFISFILLNQANNAQEYGSKDSDKDNGELFRDEARQKALDHSGNDLLCNGQISKSMNSMHLKKMDHSNLISETEIYIDERTNIRYSSLVTLKFNRKVIPDQLETSKILLSTLEDDQVIHAFEKIKKIYCEFEINKLVPTALWGDTLVINKRTNEEHIIPDWSQVVQLKI